ncbi:MAG: hypothetical protein QOI21_721 [Actinomycetota bacterium]|jgi:hypothetical protein|nr:hypothetical protein [Actinomycetota bacterium]
MTYPPQQPYGQQPQQPYGRQQPYPQQQPYGYGPPQGYPQPPKKVRTGLIVGIAIGAVVVLGGGATALFLFMNGGSSGPSGDPAATAQQYVDAVNARDGAAVRGLACTPMSESDSKFAASEFAKFGLQMTVAGPSGTPDGRQAYFWVDAKRTTPSEGERAEQRYMLPVRADGSRWCVSMGATGLPG